MKSLLVIALACRTRFALLLAVGTSLGVAAQSMPTPPEILSYEGFITDASGAALGATTATNLPVVFRIYDAPTAGNVLWTEQQAVTVSKGNFFVMLGEGSPYASEPRPSLSGVFLGSVSSDRYVEMTLGGVGTGGADLTVSPRSRLTPAPYSLLARRARTADRLVNNLGASVVQASGARVGINKSNPTEALDVQGTVTAASVAAAGSAVLGTTASAGTLVGLGVTPVGGIIMWSGSVPPTGWALCDGQATGGIQTPDLRGRFVIGAGAGTGLTERAPGQTGGEERHVTTLDELPPHEHDADPLLVFTAESGFHSHDYTSGYRSRGNPWIYSGTWYNENTVRGQAVELSTSWDGAHRHVVDAPAFDSAPAGGGQSHNNLPPFYVLAFIMRVR